MPSLSSNSTNFWPFSSEVAPPVLLRQPAFRAGRRQRLDRPLLRLKGRHEQEILLLFLLERGAEVPEDLEVDLRAEVQRPALLALRILLAPLQGALRRLGVFRTP